MLPSLAEAYDHLRVAAGSDDAKVQLCLDAATRAVENFTGKSFTASSDAFYPVPEDIVAAILLIMELLYDHRVAGQSQLFRPWSTEYMLCYPYRDLGV